jgi:hypothetical protein
VVVVAVLPLSERVVHKLGVRDHDSSEYPVEVIAVDAMRTFHLSVEKGAGRWV